MGSILCPAVEARFELAAAEGGGRNAHADLRYTPHYAVAPGIGPPGARRVGTCSGTGAILSRHTDLTCHTAALLWLHGPYRHGV